MLKYVRGTTKQAGIYYNKRMTDRISKYFSLYIFIITIFFTRIALFFFWDMSFMFSQKQDLWHHMYLGILFVFVSLFFHGKVSTYLRPIGLGLFADEFIHFFHLIGIINEVDYWSRQAITATTISVLLISFFLIKIKERPL
ncbi:hypothetical protein COW99_02725 [Candidatus Roizmanbacteria bacterium CG22_combo_CG10-13_8_21_14_all_38_20]|uniref:Uncharacterized protein n=1 Tax=Candidatus Roizmanbacteria bacterium CG22_combo_CG10-13_8_21_14_all_38_20 TaxID=1974862 RepID=A0A2H0BVI1_9BACT|nr:MAG: hypothetical protein COW99_02725 [Candidatus Roizmanbacteria bacterium CG22_combo_CG10-13_8_21_14_all_38_20]PJC32374.1 MAG: hypothetical protein CO050_00120 [Candidatus Roizmanbacteria bacterium CG_4_9_14_0_2_um_filter_38_17]